MHKIKHIITLLLVVLTITGCLQDEYAELNPIVNNELVTETNTLQEIPSVIAMFNDSDIDAALDIRIPEEADIWLVIIGAAQRKVYEGIRTIDSMTVSLDGNKVIAAMTREGSAFIKDSKEIIVFHLDTNETNTIIFTHEDTSRDYLRSSDSDHLWVLDR